MKPKKKLKTDPHLRQNLSQRLKKIEGQLRGIQNMLEKEAYCDDILNQLSSVRAAVNGVSLTLLKSHVQTCVSQRLQDRDPEILEEFMKTLQRVLR